MTRLSGIQLTIPAGSISSDALSSNLSLAASQLAQRPLMETPVKFTDMRVWDAMASLPVTTAASDDLALITGTPGTNAPKISAGDVKNATTSRKIAFELEVPPNYDDGQTFIVRIRGGMETTVASSSCTVDLQAWKGNGSGSVGSDLVLNAAQSINSLTAADKDFEIDPTGIDPGDKLTCVITIACTDVATGTAVTPTIYEVSSLVDTRG